MPLDEYQRTIQLLGPQAKLVPCERGGKVPIAPYSERPDNLFSSEAWIALCQGDVNLALLCGARSGGIIGIDFDDEARGIEWEAINSELASRTFAVAGARGWKVFLRIDGDFPPSEKTPECEWRADKNLCVVAGMHPSGVPYRTIVDAPPAAVKFEDIKWPQGWTIPGVTAAAREAVAKLEAKYGSPTRSDAKGNPVELNERFWAGMFLVENEILWCPEEGRFYRYHQETGVWSIEDETLIGRGLGDMLVGHGRRANLPFLTWQTNAKRIAHLRTHVRQESSRPGVFASDRRIENIVHVRNGMLLWRGDDWVIEPFSPEFYSRNASPVAHDPDADCPRFLNELVHHCLDKDDARTLQMMGGMFLLGWNMLQRILIIDGAAGTGKSQIVEVLMGIVGVHNCVSLRTSLLHERFEIARYIGKSLLIGSDVASNFLTEPGSEVLKSLVGGDRVGAELKGVQEEVILHGRFNVAITANARLRMRLQGDGDAAAWRRRVVILRSEAPKPEKAIPEFGRLLLDQEGPGILNWFLDGARMLLRIARDEGGARLPLTEAQQKRIDRALTESDSLREFLTKRVSFDPESDLTTEELCEGYARFCDDHDLTPLPERVMQLLIPSLMLEIFQRGKSNDIKRENRWKRGFKGVRLSEGPPSDGSIQSEEGGEL